MTVLRTTILIYLFSLNCLKTFCQTDSISLFKFEQLDYNDKLIIDYKNFSCRSVSGERLLISQTSNGIKILRIQNNEPKFIVDGKELDYAEKQKFKLDNGDFITQTITAEKFHTLINELEKIINTENSATLKFAGDSSELVIQLNKINITKQFKGWIELKSLQ